MDNEMLRRIAQKSFKNGIALQHSYDGMAGCYYCKQIYDPSLITEWVTYVGDKTAICPNCKSDTVIYDTYGHGSEIPITEELLSNLHEYWFKGPSMEDFVRRIQWSTEESVGGYYGSAWAYSPLFNRTVYFALFTTTLMDSLPKLSKHAQNNIEKFFSFTHDEETQLEELLWQDFKYGFAYNSNLENIEFDTRSTFEDFENLYAIHSGREALKRSLDSTNSVFISMDQESEALTNRYYSIGLQIYGGFGAGIVVKNDVPIAVYPERGPVFKSYEEGGTNHNEEDRYYMQDTK